MMPLLILPLLKALPVGHKFANQAGYYLHNNRWHKFDAGGHVPKGAAIASHPHAAGEHAPAQHWTDEQWSKLKLPADNANASNHNPKIDQLRQMSEAGNVTGIVGAAYGPNTYGKMRAKIANELLRLHGSKHQVVAGQKAGDHEAVGGGGAPAAPAVKQPKPKLMAWLNKHGGAAGMTSTLAGMSEAHQAKLLDAMAELGGVSVSDVRALLAQKPADNPAPAQGGLFGDEKPTETGHAEGDKWVMPLQAAVKEHKELISAAETPSKADDAEQVKEQKAELGRMEGAAGKQPDTSTKPDTTLEPSETLSVKDMASKSVAIANAAKKLNASGMTDSDFQAFEKTIKKIGAPNSVVEKIQTIVFRNPKFRPVDVHVFTGWSNEARVAVPQQPRLALPAKTEAPPHEGDTKPTHRLDHGELNIPGRTNNINAQLDRYKADQAAQAKEKAKSDAAEMKADKAKARDLLTENEAAIVAKHGAKFGVKELKHQLDQWAKWEPKKLIGFVEKFKQEQGGEPRLVLPAGPKEGDTKPAADGGTLVLRDGRWHGQGQQGDETPAKGQETPVNPAETPVNAETTPVNTPQTPAIPTIPNFSGGTVGQSVIDYYNKVAQQVLALAGDKAALEKMKADGLKPNGKGKVSNTWAGKTENSKKLLAFHAQVMGGGGDRLVLPVASAAEPAPNETGLFEQAKAAGVKGIRQGMSEKTLQDKVFLHMYGQRAVDYIQEGKRSGLPQYASVDENAARVFAETIAQHPTSVDQSNWMFDGRGISASEKFVEGGLLAEGDSKYKHKFSAAGKELAHQVLARPLKIGDFLGKKQAGGMSEAPRLVLPTPDQGPKDGDVNEEGLVFRDGRWHREDEEPAPGVHQRQHKAAKLREAGQKVVEQAQAEQNRDRNTNTARRADMAAGTLAAARKQEAIGHTMMRIADAVEAGTATHLAEVNSKTAVEALESALKQAILQSDRKLTYSQQLELRGRQPEEADFQNARMPEAKWLEGERMKMLEALKGKRGAKELANKIQWATGPDSEIIAGLKKFGLDKQLGWYAVDVAKRVGRLNRIGIKSNADLQEALREYAQYREGAKKEDPVKAAERALIGQKVGIDFFPTPVVLAQRMAEMAGIKSGMKVLEPGGGSGRLADAARNAGGDVETYEVSSQLRNLLQAKGHKLVGHDFTEAPAGETYDAVIMNPPFGNRADAAHIMQAFGMLKPGGTLVAVAGEGVFIGSDRKAVEFREWLDEHGAEIEQLPEGTFKESGTGVNTRLVRVVKEKATQQDDADIQKPTEQPRPSNPALAWNQEDALENVKQAVNRGYAEALRVLSLLRGASNSMFNGVARELTGKYVDSSGAEWSQESLARHLAPDAGPHEGDRNAEGLVFRGGRWHREDEPAQAGKYSDGRTIPKVGDKVYTGARGFGGMPAVVRGEVRQGSSGLFVAIEGAQGMVGEQTSQKRVPLSPQWTLIGEEHPDERMMREAGERLDADAAKRKADRESMLNEAASRNGTLDPATVKVGDTLEMPDGSSGAVTEIGEKGDIYVDDRYIGKDMRGIKVVRSPAPDIALAEAKADLAEELMRNPGSEKAKELIQKVAQGEEAFKAPEPAAAAEPPAAPAEAKKPARKPRAPAPTTQPDDLDPNSPNYRYRDTGYVAGSRKEAVTQQFRDAVKRGVLIRLATIDWEELESNPRQAAELITKSHLFGKVDWDALKENGMEPGAGFLLDRVYASVGTEPALPGPQSRKDYALGLETLRDRMEKCQTTDQILDVLKEIKDEMEGVMLTASESVEYQAALEKAKAREGDLIKAKSELRVYEDAWTKARTTQWELEREQESRRRRKWKPDPELDKRVAEAKAEFDRTLNALTEYKAARPYLERQARPNAFGGTSYSSDLELDAHRAWKEAHDIKSAAKARNLLNNPTTRAWATLGKRFFGVLNYRSYSGGSDAFAEHVTRAKTGKIKDWSWAEGETVRVGKPSKREVQFRLAVAETFDRKGGRAVTVDSTLALKQAFGLREVQSGNWVLNDPQSAAFHVQKTAEAFADLADLIGVPDAQVSMNGRLAMAFGARGKGNAGFGGAHSAHYDAVHRIINLTKMGGGGALAHEWFHAIDNIVKEADGGGESGADQYATENTGLLPAGELRDAFEGLKKAMTEGPHQAKEKFNYTPADLRTAKFNIDNGGYTYHGPGFVIRSAKNAEEALKALDVHFSNSLARRPNDRKLKKNVETWRKMAVAYFDNNPAGAEVEVKAGKPMSSFALEAWNLDGGIENRYWSQGSEMGARAFQAWVEDRLAAKGQRNDYLSAYADNKYYKDSLQGPQFPFPEGEERERINAAFDTLMGVLAKRGTLAKAMLLM